MQSGREGALVGIVSHVARKASLKRWQLMHGRACNKQQSLLKQNREVDLHVQLDKPLRWRRRLQDISPEPELSRNLPLARKAASCHLHTKAEKWNTWQIPWQPLAGLPWSRDKLDDVLPFKWRIGIPVSSHREMLLLLRLLLPLTRVQPWGILCPGRSWRNNTFSHPPPGMLCKVCFLVVLTQVTLLRVLSNVLMKELSQIICRHVTYSFIHFTNIPSLGTVLHLRCPFEAYSLVWKAETSRSLGSIKSHIY